MHCMSLEQRSATSARRTRATRRVPRVAGTATPPSPACASQVGRGFAARTVSVASLRPSMINTSAKILQSANLATDSQTSTSVRIQTFPQDVTKYVKTSLAVSSAAAVRVTSPTTRSTAWVRVHSFHGWWERPCQGDGDVQLLQSQWSLDSQSKTAAEQTQVLQSRIVLLKSSLYLFLMDVGTLQRFTRETLLPQLVSPGSECLLLFQRWPKEDLLWLWSDSKCEKMATEKSLLLSIPRLSLSAGE